MITTFNDMNGDETSIVTQQYEIGTYFIINNDSARQGGSHLDEKEFHEMIRKNAEEEGCTNITGSKL